MKKLFLSLIFGLLFVFAFSNTLVDNDVGDQVKIEYNQDVSNATLIVADFNFVSNKIRKNTSQSFMLTNVNYSLNIQKDALLPAIQEYWRPYIQTKNKHITSYRNFHFARGLPS